MKKAILWLWVSLDGACNKDSYEYYEYRIDDIAYEIQNSGTDFYGFDEIIKSVLEKKPVAQEAPLLPEVAPYVEGTPYKKGRSGSARISINFTEITCGTN